MVSWIGPTLVNIGLFFYEFMDSFLKPAIRLDQSYIHDTTNFINKISGLIPECLEDKVFIASMDVQSLYPNIDQKEGINAMC